MKLTVNPRQYYAVFRRRAWIIALVVVLAVGGAVYRLTSQPPQYQAEASILVMPAGIAATGLTDPGLSPIRHAYRETLLNDIVQLLRSRTISERAAEQVGGLSAAELARRVTVMKIPGTDFLIIRAADTRPEQSALIANTMAQELGNFYAQMYQASATRARVFIEQQLRLAQDQLGGAEQAVLEFQARTGAVALPEGVSRTEQRILDLQAADEAATLDETTARTRVDALRSFLAAQNDGQLASLSIATNPVIAQIRDHLTGLELQLADLRQVYTDEHPAVKVALGEIASDRERLSAEAAKVLSDKSLGISPAREQFVREMIGGEVDAAVARARAAGIRAILGKLQARLSDVPGNALAMARLQRDARDAEQLVTRLSALQQEAVMRESQAVASGQSALVVVDHAMAPGTPISLPLPQTAAMAGLLGMCLGAALAVAVEGAETRIRASRRPNAVSEAPEAVPFPSISARLGFRPFAAALGMAVVLLPVILVALVLGVMLMAGVVAGVFATVPSAQVAGVLVHFSHIGQALTHAVQTVHGLYLQ